MYLQRTFQLEPLLGAKYKYESVVIGEDRSTLDDAFKQINEDLKQFIELEKKSNPVKTGESPF